MAGIQQALDGGEFVTAFDLVKSFAGAVTSYLNGTTPDDVNGLPPAGTGELDAAVNEVIGLLDGWTTHPSEQRILDIIRALPEDQIDLFLTKLKETKVTDAIDFSGNYLEKLFADVDGEESGQLLEVLAEKGAQQALNDPWYEQILAGILNGIQGFGAESVEAIKALFKVETYEGLFALSKTLFIASGGPHGVFELLRPEAVAAARQELGEMAQSIRDGFVADWNNAKAQGREVEVAIKWITQGVLEVGSAFVGVGVANAALKASKITSAFNKVADIADGLEDLNRVEDIVHQVNPDKADDILRALEHVRGGEEVPAELLAKLDAGEWDEVAGALDEGVVPNNSHIPSGLSAARFDGLVDDFAGFISARGFSEWKQNLIDEGLTPTQIQEVVYQGSLKRGENLWKGDWKKYYEEISGTQYPGQPSHAHHLVEKGSSSPAAVESRRILEEVGINPLLNRENLTWAPNITGQHGAIPQGQLLEMLSQVRGDRDGVVNVLQQWAEIAKARK